MSEYFILPNFKHKNTVYLKLNTPIYCIPKKPWPTLTDSLIHSFHSQIHRSSDPIQIQRSSHPPIHRFLDLLIHWSTDPPIYRYHRSTTPVIYWSTDPLTDLLTYRSTDRLIYTSTDPLIYRSTVLAIYHRSTDLAVHQTTDLLINWSTDPPLRRSTDLQI